MMPKFLNFYISDHKLTSVKNNEREETSPSNKQQQQLEKQYLFSSNSISVFPNLYQKLYLCVTLIR